MANAPNALALVFDHSPSRTRKKRGVAPEFTVRTVITVWLAENDWTAVQVFKSPVASKT